jgi:Ca-activated chloride channel family protein
MKSKQVVGPIFLFILFALCVAAVGVVLAVEPQKAQPIVQQTGHPVAYSYQPPLTHPSEHPAEQTRMQKLPDDQSDGSLQIVTDDKSVAFCPLKHTDVNAEISGFLARVTVTQEFTNPSQDKVEAIYTFPLPQNAAVNDMTMSVGGRTIKGVIKKREEAQKIYTQAVQAGHTAALLDQERPNIFTQSVGNIPPGGSVKVEISYIETLKYEAGAYEFVYPMVVGPRYIPGSPSGKQGGGWAPDTDRVPDASRITPPVAGVHYGVKGTRAGHDISLAVKLDAGVTIQEIKSPTHDVEKHQPNVHAAEVKLRNENEIPNRDFVLRYGVAGAKIEDALLTTAAVQKMERDLPGGGTETVAGTNGYFTFILQPPDRVRDEDANPRELIFVLDTSGSMSGFPIETAKKVMKRAIEHMRAQDTFNLITFSGDTHVLFPQPVGASAANIAQATAFLDGQRGGGGTEMMKAIRIALGDDGSGVADCKPWQDCGVDTNRRPADGVRIVTFMTDGYVGNDMEIIGAIQKHPEARVFSFGIGSSVNRFLLDKMAEAGRGEVEYVLSDTEAPEAADRFYERVHTPVLTDISIDWHELPVTDVMPQKALDLFTAKPLVLTGRYAQPASGTITLRGKRAGKAFTRDIKVDLPAASSANQALAQLWARKKIDDVMAADWNGIQNGNPAPAIKDKVTQLGLDYGLMTQYTSFVAVEEQTVVEGGQRRTIQVPVEMPQGVSPEGVFGNDAYGQGKVAAYGYSSLAMVRSAPAKQMHTQSPGIVGGANQSVDVVAEAPSINTSMATKEVKKEHRDRKDKDEGVDLSAKLHRDLFDAYNCWKSKRANCAGVKDGKVDVIVWLEPGLDRKQLEAIYFAGLQTPARSVGAPIVDRANSIRGTIELSKLVKLAKTTGVRLVSLAK